MDNPPSEKQIEDKDLLSFIRKLDDTIKKQDGHSKKLEGIESAILEGFERNELATRDLIGLMKVVASQLNSPFEMNIDYDRIFPHKINIANLDEVKVDEVKVKKPNWYKNPDLKPIIDVLQKQYNLSLEDVVSGNKGTTTSSKTKCIDGQKGYKIYVTDTTITNYSTNSSYCEIYNGKTVYTIPAPINNGVGGATLHFSTPLPGEVGQSWYFRVTPATNIVFCSMVGFRKKAA